MRKLALIIAVIGIGALIGCLVVNPVEIEFQNLSSFINGQLIVFEGIVDEVKELRAGSLIIIDEVKVFCECHNIHAGEQARIEGIVEKFDGNLRIKALVLSITQ